MVSPTVPLAWMMLLILVDLSTASVGDRSFVYQKCVRKCHNSNCFGDKLEAFISHQPMSQQLLHWSCRDECKYTCMWVTVEAFEKDGLPVPQFHGKWPFVRLGGIQEPASMTFSVLNGLAHLSILRYSQFVTSSTHMYFVWHAGALLGLNAWTWSTIFHSKDTDFTEKMDYFCAFSIVIYNTFTLICRVLGTARWWRPLITGLICAAIYFKHIYYLAYGSFDYGYNMKVNITVAIFNLLGWFLWSVWRWKHRYVWKAIVSIVGVQMLLLLELGDFPPLWWTFDAHALWHMGTVPLALVWYSFVIDDGQYLMRHKDAVLLPKKID